MMNGMKYNSQTKWPEDRNDLGWKKPKDLFPQPISSFGLLVGPMLKIIVSRVTPTMVQYEDLSVQSMTPSQGLIFSMKTKYKDS